MIYIPFFIVILIDKRDDKRDDTTYDTRYDTHMIHIRYRYDSTYRLEREKKR